MAAKKSAQSSRTRAPSVRTKKKVVDQARTLVTVHGLERLKNASPLAIDDRRGSETAPTKKSVARKRSGKVVSELRVRPESTGTLVSVSVIEESPKRRVTYYGGLFTACLGIAFLSHGLSGLYVATLETEAEYAHRIASSATFFAQRASVIQHDEVPLETQTPVDLPEAGTPPPIDPATEAEVDEDETTDDDTASSTDEDTVEEAALEEVEEAREDARNTADNDDALSPPAQFHHESQSTIEGAASFRIDVPDALSVSFILKPAGSQLRYYGSECRSEGVTYHCEFDSRQFPNQAYTGVASVKNRFGTYDAGEVSFLIQNPVPTVTMPSITVDVPAIKEVVLEATREMAASNPMKGIAEEIIHIVRGGSAEEVASSRLADFSREILPPQDAVSDDGGEASTTDTGEEGVEPEAEDEPRDSLREFLSLRERLLDEMLGRFSLLVRGGDGALMSRMEKRIAESAHVTRIDIEKFLLEEEKAPEAKVSEALTRYDQIVQEQIGRTKQREERVRERLGIEALRDTDSDGLADYDETNLYRTHPLMADTDFDGVLDGAEIIDGFDPSLAYEEVETEEHVPEGSHVSDVQRITHMRLRKEGEEERASLAGSGIPLSFVTLITDGSSVLGSVLVNRDGSWQYGIPTSLGVGEYKTTAVYKDHRGNIVRESTPFSYEKTPHGYRNKANTAALIDSLPYAEHLSRYSFIIVVSLLLVLLGFSLMVLARRRSSSVEPNAV